MTFAMQGLVDFLVVSRAHTYAGGKQAEVDLGNPSSKRKRYQWSNGLWTVNESYIGKTTSRVSEIVSYDGKEVWELTSRGGIILRNIHPYVNGKTEEQLVEDIFDFLRICLSAVDVTFPVRGPREFSDRDLRYVNTHNGPLDNFLGSETIYFRDSDVYHRRYQGGLII